jgi:FAD/FMN-containing dehydrogenase
MHRRNLLKWGISAAALVTAKQGLSKSSTIKNTKPFRRWRPSDPQWPDASRWNELKNAVNGFLLEGAPLLSACTNGQDRKECLIAKENLRNPFFLGDQAGGTQVSGWLDAWTPAPSAYVINAHSVADVVAGVNFARDNNLRLVVKGAGHSYQGTSNAPDSLLIWTRAMNKVVLHDSFIPAGCAGCMQAVPAVTAEAGAMWIDVYYAVTKLGGRYVQGGGCTDVGVAGLIQSGGFGSFSKLFGTAASNLLEAEIVTADGQVRVANAASNPDLFWAIKGGGGGSWGVVTRVTLQTHELPEQFGSVWSRIKANSDQSFRELIARFFEFYTEELDAQLWGEQVLLGNGNVMEISMLCQGMSIVSAKRAWSPFWQWLSDRSHEFEIVGPHIYVGDARSWWTVQGNGSMIPDNREGAPSFHGWWKGDQDQVGIWIHGFESLWLPSSLLEPRQCASFFQALFTASRLKKVQLHFNKGLAGAPLDVIARVRNTATNPAVCDAFALAIIADGEPAIYPELNRSEPNLTMAREDAFNISTAMAALRAVVKDHGSYVSESDFFNKNWQQEFWGNNYRRLIAIKKRYDPEGLFIVHHGVGSNAWSADGFERLPLGYDSS